MSQSLLLIEAARIKQIDATLSQHNKTWIPLYQDSHWSEQIQFSPYLVQLDSENDSLLPLFNQDQTWGNQSVIYLYPDDMSLQQINQDLQRNISLYSEKGQLYLVRFYHAPTLINLMATLNDHQKSQLLGASEQVIFSPLFNQHYQTTGYRNPDPKPDQAPLMLSEQSLSALIG